MRQSLDFWILTSVVKASGKALSIPDPVPVLVIVLLTLLLPNHFLHAEPVEPLLPLDSTEPESALFVAAEPSYKEARITGFTRARAIIELATEVAGKSKVVYADVGDTISGDTRFTCLDDKLISFDVDSSKNEINRHAVDINYYQKQVTRYQQLLKSHSTAQSQLDELVRQLGLSRRLLQAERIRRDKLIETRSRYCVQAPLGWKVTERYIEPGQWVNVGQVIAKLGDYSRLLVPLYLSQEELQSLKQMEGNLDVSFPEHDKIVPARLERISPAFDEESRKFKVELQLQEALPDSHGGIRVELLLKLSDEEGTFLLPANTVDERFEEFWLERQDGKEIRVDLLGYKKRGDERWARVASTEIEAGDQFKLKIR